MELTNTIIIFFGCVISIILFRKIIVSPLKLVIKLFLNSLLGAVIIGIINLIGGAFGFNIGLNILTAIFVRSTWNTRSSINNSN